MRGNPLVKRIPLICGLVIASIIAAISQVPTNTGDLVLLAGGWWGCSIADFPKIAGLNQGEYSVIADPIDPNAQVIFVRRDVAERWAPKELAPFNFGFSRTEGLREISGFYQIPQEELLAILIARYGNPVRQVQALGMKAYGWDVGHSQLGLRHGLFVLNPQPKK
jgi:hypothetical protein